MLSLKYLGISTPVIISSSLNINNELKSQDLVLEICKSMNAKEYINAIGGIELYEKEVFNRKGVSLQYIRSREICYKQFSEHHIPWLSIIDLMMFNSLDDLNHIIKTKYDLI